MKRIICLILALAMVFCLSACGNNAGGKDKGGASGEQVQVTGTDWAKDVTIPKVKNAEVSWMLSADYDTMKQYDREDAPNAFYQTWNAWEATTGVKVDVQKVVWDNFTTHLTTSAASGEMPDIVYGGTVWFPSWPAKGLVQPIDDYIDLSDKKWNKEIMDQLVWGGKHYVAYGQQPELFYICYNKTKFELAGEKTPLEHYNEGTWNWTQFKQTAKNMTNKSANEYGYNGWCFSLGKCIYPLFNIEDDGSLKSQMATPKMKRWFSEIYDLYHSGAARCDNEMSNFLTTFPSGKDAMIHISQEEYIRIQKMLELTGGDEFEIAPNFVFDPNEETQPMMATNIYGFSITSQSKNPEGAAALINLYYDVWNNIENSYGELGQFGKYLSEAEQKAVIEANKAPVTLNFAQGLGSTQSLFNSYCRDTIYSATKEGSVSALLDSFDGVFNAELKEFSGSIK